jgi:L-ascorbate metabolism protein UlaG (beta-lactamase superfamily)
MSPHHEPRSPAFRRWCPAVLGRRLRPFRLVRHPALPVAVSLLAAGPVVAQEHALARPLGTGEAQIWYLGHSGWAIRTEHHFLIFDYWEAMKTMPPGATFVPPADASLATGYIVPAEIADENVIVFVSHAHSDHFDPVVLTWNESIPGIRYVFGWDVEGPPDILRVDEPRKGFTIDDVRIHTISHDFDGIPEAAFLVEADGVTLYHSGDHGGGASTAQRFAANIDYFAGIAHDIDIAFTVTWGGTDYVVDKLSPKVVFPQHDGGAEYRLRRWAEQGAGARLRARVLVPERRGDRFLYAGGAATVMP